MSGKQFTQLSKPIPLKEILDRGIRKVPYLVEGIIPVGEPMGIFGAGESWKSWFALELARSVASGEDFLGRFKVLQPGPVVFFDRENYGDRLCARCLGLRFDKDISLSFMTDGKSDGINFDSPHFAEQMRGFFAELHPSPVLAIFDSFTRFFRGDENRAGDVAQALDNISEVCRSVKVSLVIIHHTRKGGSRESRILKERIRGSIDFTNAISVGVFLDRIGDKIRLEMVKNRDNVPFNPIGLEFSEFEKEPSWVGFKVVDAPVQKQTQKMIAEEAILKLLDENPDGLRQIELCTRLERTFKKSAVKGAIRSLEKKGKVEIEPNVTGRGRSPLVRKMQA